MGRGNYKYFEQKDFSGGLCLDAELAAPNQLQTAENVWAPNGRLETRPGYTGVFPMVQGNAQLGNTYYGVEDTSTGVSVFTEKIGSLTIGLTEDFRHLKFYFGTVYSNLSQVRFNVFGQCDQRWAFSLEYYQGGGRWGALSYIDSENLSPYFCYESEYSAISFAPPNGWVPLEEGEFGTIAVYDGSDNPLYYLRLVPIIINDTSITRNSGSAMEIYGDEVRDQSDIFERPIALLAPQVASGKFYIFITQDTEGNANFPNTYLGRNSPQIGYITDNQTALGQHSPTEPFSYAAVPLFDEVFLSSGYQVFRFDHDGTSELAAVENDPDFVGEDSPFYASDEIAQFADFPRAKYIMFFNGRLWAANIEGAEVQFQWSAPQPFHKVWPVINVSNIMEDDNSPITGLSSFGENPVIFKNDSIWLVRLVGRSEVGEDVYEAQKIVTGKGAVSNSSIVRTPVGLIFLAEDGVYVFNGTPFPKKISMAIDSYFSRVYEVRRPFCTAVHWKTENCYLLALSVDGSLTNNVVLCYNYEDNSWFEWLNMPVEIWMVDEAQNDNEQLYFADSLGSVYLLGGAYDHGATIETKIITHRMGYDSFNTKTLREIRAATTNLQTSVNIEVLTNDTPEGLGAAGTLILSSENEAKWDTTETGGDDGFIKPLWTTFPGALGDLISRQYNLPGARKLVFGLRNNLAISNGAWAAGTITQMTMDIEGYDADGVFLSETINLYGGASATATNLPFAVSTNSYYKVTKIDLTTAAGLNGSTDSDYFIGYAADEAGPLWVGERRRERRWTCRETGEWFQIKLTSAESGQPFKLDRLSAGYLINGVR